MAKKADIFDDKKLNKKSETFINKTDSEMIYKSELSSDALMFDWVNEIEFACLYIDNIIRNPKLALINEEDVVKIGKAKKITVSSVKDLSRHTHYIEKIDKKTNEIQPSKILITRREETYNTYENRFVYTLVNNLDRFMTKKEKLLSLLEVKNNKVLEYKATTNAGNEKINIDLKITSDELPNGKNAEEFEKEINSIKLRVKKIRDYLGSWQRSEFIQSLETEKVAFIMPPIRKTNVILKNPNFQIAIKLWAFIQYYNDKDNEGTKDGLDIMGNNTLKGILDDAFLMNYFVLDSISSSKREQKEKLAKYAVIMINQQVQRAVSLLLNSGIKISDEEIIGMLSKEINSEKNKIKIGSTDVKKKFKNAMEEYLDNIENYM